MSCFEDGLITIKDTEGIELMWGNHKAIVEMTEKIIKREGFGDILADGVKKASERIGKCSEKYAIHICGQELPAHDPRFEPSIASIYKNNATPGRHTQDTEYHPPAKLSELMPHIDFSFSFGKKRNIFTGRAKAQRVLSALSHCVNAMGLCQFGFLSTEVTFMPESYYAVTGVDINLDELIIIGERIGDMRLAFNIREGINPVKLKLPNIVLGKPPLEYGPTKGITVDLNIISKEFYKEMDWDIKTSKPSKKRLMELGLDWLIKDLWDNV